MELTALVFPVPKFVEPKPEEFDNVIWIPIHAKKQEERAFTQPCTANPPPNTQAKVIRTEPNYQELFVISEVDKKTTRRDPTRNRPIVPKRARIFSENALGSLNPKQAKTFERAPAEFHPEDFLDQLPGELSVFQRINLSGKYSRDVSRLADQNSAPPEHHKNAYVSVYNQNILGQLHLGPKTTEEAIRAQKESPKSTLKCKGWDTQRGLVPSSSSFKQKRELEERNLEVFSANPESPRGNLSHFKGKKPAAESLLIKNSLVGSKASSRPLTGSQNHQKNSKKLLLVSKNEEDPLKEQKMKSDELDFFIIEEQEIKEEDLEQMKKKPNGPPSRKSKNSNERSRFIPVKRINSISLGASSFENSSSFGGDRALKEECSWSLGQRVHQVPCILLKPRRPCDMIVIYLHGNAEDIFHSAEMGKGIRDELNVKSSFEKEA